MINCLITELIRLRYIGEGTLEQFPRERLKVIKEMMLNSSQFFLVEHDTKAGT